MKLLKQFTGDGSTCLRFVHLISDYYQGLEPTSRAPKYGPYMPPADGTTDYESIDFPHLQNRYPIGFSPYATDGKPLYDPVTFRFTAMQLKEIYQGAVDVQKSGGDKYAWFSRSDFIIALLAESLSQADQTIPPVRSFTNVINVHVTCPHSIHLH